MKRTISFVLTACMILQMLLFASPVAGAVGQNVLFVSTTGNDENDGSYYHPFATIQKAQEVVRDLVQTMTDNIYVYFRGGVYYLDEPIELTEADSGQNGHQVIYCRNGDESVTFSGGTVVTNWSLHDSQLNIWEADVGTGTYSRHLYVDGKAATRAEADVAAGLFRLNDYGFSIPTSGFFSGMSRWQNASDIEIHQSVQWAHPWGSVNKIENGIIYMDQPFWGNTRALEPYNIAMNYPEKIVNAYEIMDTPDEWYLSRETGTLYYIPKDGEDPNNHTMVLGQLETLVSAASNDGTSKVHDIVFNGIKFANTTWLAPGLEGGYTDHQAGVANLGEGDVVSHGALEFRNVYNIGIQNCEISQIGSSGIVFRAGCKNNFVSGCVIRDIAINGICVGEIDEYNHHEPIENQEDIVYENIIVSDNTISYNTISNIGCEIDSAVGIFGGYVTGLVIDHNTLSDLPYTAISVGWGWGAPDQKYSRRTVGANKITCNYISDYMKSSYDGGGIYTLGRQDESLIAYNYINNQHNQYALIYLDNGTQGYTVRDNVVGNAGECNTWLLANDACGGEPYLSTRNNVIEYNYYELNMEEHEKCPPDNIYYKNIEFSGDGSYYVQKIINCAGVDSDDPPGQRGESILNQLCSIKNVETGKMINELSKDSGHAVQCKFDGGIWYLNEAGQCDVYQICSAHTGNVITPRNHATSDSIGLISYVNQGNNSQKWYFEQIGENIYKIKSVNNPNLCLTEMPDGYVYQCADENLDRQKWKIETGKGILRLKDAAGQVVGEDESCEAGSYVTLESEPPQFYYLQGWDSSGVTLKWITENTFVMPQEFVAISPVFSDERIVSIVNKENGKALTCALPEVNGGGLIQETFNGKNSQLWRLVENGSYYIFENVWNGYAITPANHSSEAGEGLIVYNRDTNKSQDWEIVMSLEEGDSSCYIKSRRNPSICITPGYHSALDGAPIIQWTNESSSDQLWLFEDQKKNCFVNLPIEISGATEIEHSIVELIPDGAAPMPDNPNGAILELWGSGILQFGKIEFSRPGEYKYIVRCYEQGYSGINFATLYDRLPREEMLHITIRIVEQGDDMNAEITITNNEGDELPTLKITYIETLR